MAENEGGYFFCFFLTLLVLNVPFIVCDLVFSAKEGCAEANIKGMALTLESWLFIDAISRSIVISLFLISAITTAVKEELGIKFGIGSFFLYILFTLFQLAWLIVGGVLYWGNLDKNKVCDAMTIGYMYSLLILGFLAIIPNALVGVKSWV